MVSPAVIDLRYQISIAIRAVILYMLLVEQLSFW